MLKKIKDEAYLRYLNAQRIWRYVQSDIFEKVYSQATEEQKEELFKIDNIYELKKLINKIMSKNDCFILLSVYKLRQLGKKYGIARYNYLNKQELIEEIKNAIRKNENIT